MRAGFPKRNSCDNRGFRIVPVEKQVAKLSTEESAQTLQMSCRSRATDTCSQWQVLTQRRFIAGAEGVTFGFSLPHWSFNPTRTLVGRLT